LTKIEIEIEENIIEVDIRELGFTSNALKSDMGGRDFTCNSLYFDPMNEILFQDGFTTFKDPEQIFLPYELDIRNRIVLWIPE
jgi:hypothetical protein